MLFLWGQKEKIQPGSTVNRLIPVSRNELTLGPPPGFIDGPAGPSSGLGGVSTRYVPGRPALCIGFHGELRGGRGVKQQQKNKKQGGRKQYF